MKVAKLSESKVKVGATRWDEIVKRGDVLEDIGFHMWISANEAFDELF